MNKSGAHGAVKNLQKLENESEVFEHERVSTELKKQIQSARIAKKLTQAQLGQLINEKPQVINEYESGKAIPNPQVRTVQRMVARRNRKVLQGEISPSQVVAAYILQIYLSVVCRFLASCQGHLVSP